MAAVFWPQAPASHGMHLMHDSRDRDARRQAALGTILLWSTVLAAHALVILHIGSSRSINPPAVAEPAILHVHWRAPQTPARPEAVPTTTAPAIPEPVMMTPRADVAPRVTESPRTPRHQRRQAHGAVPATPQAAPMPVAVVNAQPAATSATAPAQRAPAPTDTTAAVPAAAVPQQAAQFDADYLDNPQPHYPEFSRRLGEQGQVLLRVHVSAHGRPESITLHRSSGFPRLDRAAEHAVSRWRFVPARQGDDAIDSWVVVPVTFSLRDRA